MKPIVYSLIILSYFVILVAISIIGNRSSGALTFFNANRNSKWYWVALGMVGATLSGVTFISVPGEVTNSGFKYFQFVMGNVVGYMIISRWLLPYYYRNNVLSIYKVLNQKMGVEGEKTAAFFFMLSKIIGAAFRLFLAAGVVHMAILQNSRVPFYVTVAIVIALIWLYTFRGGIKTIVVTDVVQTIVLLIAAVTTVVFLVKQINLSERDYVAILLENKVFDWEWKSANFFGKQFLAGIVLTLSINGFDQDIMQKNLTCKNEKEAGRNMFWFSIVFLLAVAVFLVLGGLLYQYSLQANLTLPKNSDDVFPFLALNNFPGFISILFVLGISAAAFSSADSALTSLTTSLYVDFLDYAENREDSLKNRRWIHLLFGIILWVTIVGFYYLIDESVVIAIFKFAGYTYGPILGMFAYTFLCRFKIAPKMIILASMLSPIFTYLIVVNSTKLLFGYQFGFEIIIVNALLFVNLLYFLSKIRLVVKNS